MGVESMSDSVVSTSAVYYGVAKISRFPQNIGL